MVRGKTASVSSGRGISRHWSPVLRSQQSAVPVDRRVGGVLDDNRTKLGQLAPAKGYTANGQDRYGPGHSDLYVVELRGLEPLS